METVYFTITAIILYLLADWILRRVEESQSKTLKYRNIIFFFLLLFLALTAFSLIRYLTEGTAS